jgi:hypothetical protein
MQWHEEVELGRSIYIVYLHTEESLYRITYMTAEDRQIGKACLCQETGFEKGAWQGCTTVLSPIFGIEHVAESWHLIRCGYKQNSKDGNGNTVAHVEISMSDTLDAT